jgi:putative heme-binding domain-containing protein
MIARIALALSLTCLTSFAQRSLKDIPDPAVAKQLAGFNLPEGMEINLYASDPMIAKPVQMNWDAQGRLWLVSSGMYPHIVPGAEENDRVLVLEDTNGDGTADKSTVFADDLHIPTAVIPGDGGAYVANSTEILFLKDTDGDLVADERRTVLSGFGTEDTHHLVHTFAHGPDGMLYFSQSIYIHSHLETPYGVRRLMGGGTWHFRPETQQTEVLYKGLVNPWGFVFDDYGQTFASDGAGGEGINFIFPHAVYRSSPGAKKVLHGLNPGQPKLCGLEILSGTHVPEEMRDLLIAPDFRGHRINAYRLTPNGSTYTSTQVDDFLSSSHRAFRPIDVKMGPDGALYIADWYNPIIQHGEVDFRDERRDHTHGRIWRVTFKDRPLAKKPDLIKATTEELLDLQLSPERFNREFARRELRHRGGTAVLPLLQKWALAQKDDFARLQAMWTLQSLNTTNIELVEKLAASKDARYRAAALRFLYHRQDEVPSSSAIIEKAIHDEHAQVRLWAISCLAQKPTTNSVPIALGALDHEVDTPIDFALWSIVRKHQDHWVPAFENGSINFNGKLSKLIFAISALEKPIALDSLFKGLAAGEIKGKEQAAAISVIAKVGSVEDLNRLLALTKENKISPAIALAALLETKKIGKRQPSKGTELITELLDSTDPALYQKAALLSGLWKIEPARQKLIDTFVDSKSPAAKRQAAAEGLRSFGGKQAIAIFEKMVRESQTDSIKALAVKELANLNPGLAAMSAVAILAQDSTGSDPHGLYDVFLKNPKASTALAKALKGQKLPRNIASTGVQRAGTSGIPPKDLISALLKAGDLKPMAQKLSPADMATLVDRVRKDGNPHRGEQIYRRQALQCTVCHAIGGVGSPIGPDLVSIGASAPIDYLVTSLLDPTDKIKEGYHTTMVTTKNGDTFTGGLVSEGDQEITLRDNSNRMIKIAKADVKSKIISPVSMMPPGLTASLREDEFIDLVRFLSELGKEGDFKVNSRPLIRNWVALQPTDRIRNEMGHYGPGLFAEPSKEYTWTPVGSFVNGELPTAVLPQIPGNGRSKWGAVRFGVPQSTTGSFSLKINDTQSMHLFDGEKQIKLPKKGPATIEFKAGDAPQRFTIAINSGYRSAPILVEVLPTQSK